MSRTTLRDAQDAAKLLKIGKKSIGLGLTRIERLIDESAPDKRVREAAEYLRDNVRKLYDRDDAEQVYGERAAGAAMVVHRYLDELVSAVTVEGGAR